MFVQSAFVIPRSLGLVGGGSIGHAAEVFAEILKRSAGLTILSAAVLAFIARKSRVSRTDFTLIALLLLELLETAVLSVKSSGAWYNYAIQAVLCGSILAGRGLATIDWRLVRKPAAIVAFAAVVALGLQVRTTLRWTFARLGEQRALARLLNDPFIRSHSRDERFFAQLPQYNRLYGRQDLIYDDWLYAAFQDLKAAEPLDRWVMPELVAGRVHWIIGVDRSGDRVPGLTATLPELGFRPERTFGPYHVWRRLGTERVELARTATGAPGRIDSEAGPELPGPRSPGRVILDHDPEDFLRIVANPFLGLAVAFGTTGGLLYFIAKATPDNSCPNLAVVFGVAVVMLFVSGRLVVYHCRDCGETGRLRYWRRHNCALASERRRLGARRRLRGPTPGNPGHYLDLDSAVGARLCRRLAGRRGEPMTTGHVRYRRPSRLWITIVLISAAGCAALTIWRSIERYHDFRLGWSWDLAYYNQWFRALTNGEGVISVRPAAGYATEGPSIWKMNYLAPIRLVIAPIYAIFPSPITLLVIEGLFFWLIVPAAYTLARSEGAPPPTALSAAALVTLTPLVWPLALNDFRELQMGLPFVLWAIQGYRSRDFRLCFGSCLVLLACRQEFAIFIASLALLPPLDQDEDPRVAQRRRLAVFLGGVAWFFWAFLGYLAWRVGPNAPEHFLEEFRRPRPALGEVAITATRLWFLGLGAWGVLAWLAPRVALLALPGFGAHAAGRWSIDLLRTESWHHVRYAGPMVAVGLAAGVIGFTRALRVLDRIRAGLSVRVGFALVCVVGLSVPRYWVISELERVPRSVAESDIEPLWHWIERVKPGDGVVAHYDFSAQLSCRSLLSSYILDQNKPRGFPTLDVEYGWAFLKPGDLPPQVLVSQGFECVYSGKSAVVYRRSR